MRGLLYRLALLAVGVAAPARSAVTLAPPDTTRRVPMTAPDSVATALWDSITAPANLLHSPPGITGTLIRDLVYVRFRPGTTQGDRQAAIDLVHGRVVGGMGIGAPEQFYAVRLPYVLSSGDSSSGPILRAHAALSRLPTIAAVIFGLMDEMKLSYHLRPMRLDADTRDTNPRARLTLVPPDFTPMALFESLGTVSGPPLSGGPYRKDIIVVEFRLRTPLSARQAAIDSISGVVVGGERYTTHHTDDGRYYVRIPGGTTAALLSAIQILHRQPQVAVATWWELFLRSEQSSPRRPSPRG